MHNFHKKLLSVLLEIAGMTNSNDDERGEGIDDDDEDSEDDDAG
jgi:hypothetical protein